MNVPMGPVAVVTCRLMPEPDNDEELLMGALAAAGVDAHLVAWDGDPDRDWGRYRAAVVRSTWNYIDHLDRFTDWARSTAEQTVLANPAPVIEWNTHKSYLKDLAARGLPVVPTAWVPRGASTALAAIMDDTLWDDVVVKPVVGAGSYLTERVRDPDSADATAFWQRLVGERDAMVQPYLSSVADYGERSLIWIDGEFTHAVRKAPRMGDDEESVSEALPIAADEGSLAEQALAMVGHDLLYARVDLIRDDAGDPLVAELELVEPSLFLAQHPPALARFVAAIAALR